MTLNKREQNIAWAVGCVVGIIVLYFLVNGVYLSTLNDVNDQITKAKNKSRDDANTLLKAKIDDQQWTNMDILSDPAAMGQEVHDAVTRLAGQAQIQVSNWRATTVTRPVPKTDYQEATFDLQAHGNTAGFAKFLYTLESSHTPMRVDRLDISSQPLGQDDLNITLALTALIYEPKPVKGVPTATRPASTQVSRSASTKPGAGTQSAAETAAEKATEEKLKKQRMQDLKNADQPATAPATSPAAAPTLTPAAAPATGAASDSSLEDIEAKLKKAREQEMQSLDAPATAPAIAPAGGAR